LIASRGRAVSWHPEGQGLESPWLHREGFHVSVRPGFTFWAFFRIGHIRHSWQMCACALCGPEDEFDIQPPITGSMPHSSAAAALSRAGAARLTCGQSPNQPRLPRSGPYMKTSQVSGNCDREGAPGRAKAGAPYAVYNRIGTLGNGFLALIGQTCPAHVEDGT